MDFGYDGCDIEFGPTLQNMDLDAFYDVMNNDNRECKYIGFTKHPTDDMGSFITKYDTGCQSPPNRSWPLYLGSGTQILINIPLKYKNLIYLEV